MKKYIVTEKHGILKNDVIIFYTNNKYVTSFWAHEFASYEITDWIIMGWIEEIKEPEFTKHDMISFGRFIEKNGYMHFNWNDLLDKWIEEQTV